MSLCPVRLWSTSSKDNGISSFAVLFEESQSLIIAANPIIIKKIVTKVPIFLTKQICLKFFLIFKSKSLFLTTTLYFLNLIIKKITFKIISNINEIAKTIVFVLVSKLITHTLVKNIIYIFIAKIIKLKIK